eukprot:920387_1
MPFTTQNAAEMGRKSGSNRRGKRDKIKEHSAERLDHTALTKTFGSYKSSAPVYSEEPPKYITCTIENRVTQTQRIRSPSVALLSESSPVIAPPQRIRSPSVAPLSEFSSVIASPRIGSPSTVYLSTSPPSSIEHSASLCEHQCVGWKPLTIQQQNAAFRARIQNKCSKRAFEMLCRA